MPPRPKRSTAHAIAGVRPHHGPPIPARVVRGAADGHVRTGRGDSRRRVPVAPIQEERGRSAPSHTLANPSGAQASRSTRRASIPGVRPGASILLRRENPSTRAQCFRVCPPATSNLCHARRLWTTLAGEPICKDGATLSVPRGPRAAGPRHHGAVASVRWKRSDITTRPARQRTRRSMLRPYDWRLRLACLPSARPSEIPTRSGSPLRSRTRSRSPLANWMRPSAFNPLAGAHPAGTL